MKKLSILVLSGFLTACVLEDESSDPTFLEGSFAKECVDYDENGTVYGFPSYVFKGNNVVIASNTYSDSDCQTLRSTGDIEASFTIGETVILPESGLEATKVKFNYSKFIRTPLNEEAVSTYNSDEFCGFTDWALNESKDILSCFIEGKGENLGKEIVYLDGNTLDFGDLDYLDADGYPTRLLGDPATRQ